MRIKRVREISLEKFLWKNHVRKKTNRKLTKIILIFLIGFFLLFNVYHSPAFQRQFDLIGNVISEFGEEPTNVLVNVNFDDEVGIVRDDFYGTQFLSVFSPAVRPVRPW